MNKKLLFIAIIISLIFALTFAVACGDGEEDKEDKTDTGETDTGKDAGEETETDAGEETETDAGEEAETDAGEEAETDAGEEAETDGKMVLRFNNGAEPQTLDPAIMTGVPEGRLARQLFEGLVVEDDKTLEPLPGVAESWDIEENRVFTFHLRKDAKWSDGTPITADTFKYSWMRVLNPETAAQYAYQLWYIKNAEAYTNGEAKAEEVGIEVIDEYTLKVELDSPTPFFLGLVAFYTYLPQPKHVIDKVGGDKWYTKENIVCNGAFMLADWKPQNHVKLVPNPEYYERDKVKLDEVYAYPYEDGNTALEMYLNGELDYITGVPTERMDEMKKSDEFHAATYLGTYYYRINVTEPPLDSAKVRMALAMTMDRTQICRYITKAGQIPAYSWIPNNMPGYEFENDIWEEDTEEAQKLLAEAGYPNGEGFPEITLLYNTSESHKKVAEAIQQMWKEKLGINVSLENAEWKVYLDKVNNMDYQIARAGWIGDYVDPNTFADMFVTDGGNNNTGWSNARYDELIQMAKVEQDSDKRMEYFAESEKILMNELPLIPIYYYVNVYMLKNYVNGIYENILDNHRFKYVTVNK